MIAIGKLKELHDRGISEDSAKLRDSASFVMKTALGLNSLKEESSQLKAQDLVKEFFGGKISAGQFNARIKEELNAQKKGKEQGKSL